MTRNASVPSSDARAARRRPSRPCRGSRAPTSRTPSSSTSASTTSACSNSEYRWSGLAESPKPTKSSASTRRAPEWLHHKSPVERAGRKAVQEQHRLGLLVGRGTVDHEDVMGADPPGRAQVLPLFDERHPPEANAAADPGLTIRSPEGRMPECASASSWHRSMPSIRIRRCAIHRDLELIEHLDRLGYDEAWIGEHHSAGWRSSRHPRCSSPRRPSARSTSSSVRV